MKGNTKEGSFSTSYILFKFQALLELYVSRTQKACKWGNQNMVKVTKTFLQWRNMRIRKHKKFEKHKHKHNTQETQQTQQRQQTWETQQHKL